MDARDLDAVYAHVDMIWIGARNMQNFNLCRARQDRQAGHAEARHVGNRRGALDGREYVAKEGNEQIILCERGIRTFERSTRFTLDIGAIPVLKAETHLPVVVDPSHAAGKRQLVAPLARAAVAAGADGLIVETHPNPSTRSRTRRSSCRRTRSAASSRTSSGCSRSPARRSRADARVKVAIVGLGLMGGSLGLALAARAGAVVAGHDPDPEARRAALARGCVAAAHDTLDEACAEADIVVVCVPVAQLPDAVGAALRAAPAQALVTDIGSTKANVVRSVPAGERHRFVGGHPVCGSEARGAGNARAELFEGATWFLTPVADTDADRYTKLHAAVVAVGARPLAIDPGAHDRLVALTSHLPHVLANLLATQAAAGTIDGHDPLATVGGSFRDMTRVAGANPRIWVDIFLDNRDALAAGMREHRRRLDEVLDALEAGDAGFLARWVGQAAQARRGTLQTAYEARADDLRVVRVQVPDRPGVISGIAQALGAARINIEDFVLHHRTPDRGGVIELVVADDRAASAAVDLLEDQGYGASVARIVAEIPAGTAP
jgi:prephenate dehydrogenase